MERLGAAPVEAMTLRQFTSAVGDALRTDPRLQLAWVAAELSDVRTSGGHCYMELIEKDAAGATVAKMRATIWQSTFGRLRAKFEQAAGRPFATGLKVLLCGSATHHSVYGLSFNVIDVDPSYTLGDMERLRREILRRLAAEGVLERNARLALDAAPQRIAVISAAGAAGYGDFCNQLADNPYGFQFYPHLFGAVMQGDRTSASVRAALEAIEMTIDLWDCVVIIRGGGSTSDLNGFDDLELARAVATFPLPVLVGIGHERDRTVLDEIANVRLKTPTAVAAFLIDRLTQAYAQAITLTRRVATYARQRVEGEQRNVASLAALVPSLARTRLAESSTLLSRLAAGLPRAAASKTEEARARLRASLSLIRAAAASRTAADGRRLQTLAASLRAAAPLSIRNASTHLDGLQGIIAALSPQNTLQRGYSITRIDGRAIRSASEASKGCRMRTFLADGCLESIVEAEIASPQSN